VGERARSGDLAVNVCKKSTSNMRSSTRDVEVRLNAPRDMSLDEAIEFLADDELLEVTPVAFRIRKRLLDRHDRHRQAKQVAEVENE
jgi:GTP-binding protein